MSLLVASIQLDLLLVTSFSLVGVHFYLLFLISFGAEIAVKIGCVRLQRPETFPFIKEYN